ncbi:unnamed protein product [Triticum turgidum subsp. durum]|uniref:Uncharacterized protein n=1 Tax=Triticum turgidum subsp. durum TaxID=4567 RepID=A0A9R1C5D6_TRITD|nr:unnamed protein product [Triticum turgidum subsp. durum]
MKARQLVNVVMRRYGMGSSLYAVSRIKPEEQLFYPSTKEAQASSTGEMETISISRMPAPSLRLELSVSKEDKRLDFLPFYERGSGGHSKILCVDAEGRTVLYDTDAGLLHSMPCLGTPKGPNPVSFSILDREPRDPGRADALYVMGRCCDYFDFEALMYCDPSSGRKGWRWHQLLPPPVPRAAASAVGCHALIHDEGDPILVVSSAKTSGVGTHCFNTSTNRWFKAGRWTLPFVGRAERVSELDNLWFGIGGGWPYDLCAMDLYSLRAAGAEAPGLAYSWGDLSLPDDWVMMDCSMVYLGGGKFCVAKIFEFCVGDDRLGMGAVISGLEVVRRGEPSKLVMVKHKSKFYKFTRDEIECIL